MTLTRIAFPVPRAPGRLPALLVDDGGTSAELDLSDAKSASASMARAAGRTVTVSFDGGPDPEVPLMDARVALQDCGTPFWSIRDAYADEAGRRHLGEVRLSVTGEPGDWEAYAVPWTHGEPAFDAATLSAAGVPGGTSAAIMRALGMPVPDPRRQADPDLVIVGIVEGRIVVSRPDGSEAGFDSEADAASDAALAVSEAGGGLAFSSSCDFPVEFGRPGFDAASFGDAVSESLRASPTP